jgi:YegS/Rv2252/BmrU family lipid kinase
MVLHRNFTRIGYYENWFSGIVQRGSMHHRIVYRRIAHRGPCACREGGEGLMKKVALIYNPHSGSFSEKRLAQLREVTALLNARGIAAALIPTRAAGSAPGQAREAVEQGCDTILACGGDGTANEILQGLVHTDAALGVLPQGTANALAKDLGIPANPRKAIEILLKARPARIPVGEISYMGFDGRMALRYFTVAAGVGADGQFFARLDSRLKRKYGYLIYLVEALRLWATHDFPLFNARIAAVHTVEGGIAGPPASPDKFSQLLAVRITNFGGVVQRLVPGAHLRNPGLNIIATRSRSRFAYLKFIFAVFFSRQTFWRTFELYEAKSVECTEQLFERRRIFVEADGELLGTLPAKITVCPDALTLLVPAAQP